MRRFIVLIAIFLFAIHSVAAQGQLTLVSVNSTGTGSGNKRSGDFGRFRITPDGRFVVFYSEATDLFPLGAIGAADIFVRDLETGQTKMASINMAGTPSSGVSSFGLISDNGRFVAFTSFANNVVNNDTNSSPDVFIRDFQTNTTKLVSVNAAGTASGALGGSELLDMTPDGRFIVFTSHAVDLTPIPDGNGFGMDIYVRDTVNNVTKLVSVSLGGSASGNQGSFEGKISADGRYVVFTSDASDLVGHDTSTRDVFIRDLQTNITKRVSTDATGTQGGNNQSFGGIIDKGGHYVVFATRATNLAAVSDTNDLVDLFIYDIQAGTKKLITVNTNGTATGGGFPPDSGFFDHGAEFSINANGSFVAFMSQQTNLVTNDTNGNNDDVFLYNVATQAKTLVSVNPQGNNGTIGGSFKPSVSDDGRYVAFESLANDLVTTPDETNGFTMDVFVRDMQGLETFLVSRNSAGTRTGNGFSFQPLMTSDGKRLVFFTRASDLITNDLNGFNEDVFVFNLPGTVAPIILKEQNSDRAIALDLVTVVRDPFPLTNPFNFGEDQRTRISLFVWGLDLLPGEDKTAVTVRAENSQGTQFDMPVEHVGDQAGVVGVKQVVVRMPDGVSGDLGVTVSIRGLTSNRAVIRINP